MDNEDAVACLSLALAAQGAVIQSLTAALVAAKALTPEAAARALREASTDLQISPTEGGKHLIARPLNDFAAKLRHLADSFGTETMH